MEIKCEFRNIWIPSGDLYTCIITSASIKERNQEIKTFIGEHKAGKTDRDVVGIYFQNTNVHYMPRGISKFFPNLKVVWINNCGLKEIIREDLIGFENIEALSLRNNDLTSLPDDLFEGMKKLRSISFSNNKLEFVSSQLLQPVLENHLEFVSFWNNPTINAAFNTTVVNPSGVYVDLPGLIKLIEKCKKPPKTENQIKPSTSGEPLGNFFAQSFKEFWTSGKFSDFTIIVGDKKFKVHKTVLAMQSEYFAETFEKADDAIAELKTDDFSVEAVEAVLNWMYTGEIGKVTNIAEVFSITMKLKISGLKPIAEELALKSINEDNAVEIFKLGNKFNCEKIKKSAFSEVKKFLFDPDLDEEMMNEPEKFGNLVQIKKKLAEAKKNYEEALQGIKNSCKKRKLNDK